MTTLKPWIIIHSFTYIWCSSLVSSPLVMSPWYHNLSRTFSVMTKQLYRPLCLFVGRSVFWLVHLSVSVIILLFLPFQPTRMTSHVHQRPMSLSHFLSLINQWSTITLICKFSPSFTKDHMFSSPIYSGPPLKRLTFSLSVNVIECKHLNGTGLNPICYIQLGPIKKRTQKIVGTNEPAFNQVIRQRYASKFVLCI